MSVVRTLACCFYILEMSSIHTGELTNNNVLNPSSERSQTTKIALHFTERPLTTVVTFFRRKLPEFFIPSWMILADQHLPRKYDPRQMIRTFLKTPVVFSGFSRGVARIFPEVRPTFSTSSCVPPPQPPTTPPQISTFFKVPLLDVGLTVVRQSIFAVYEMAQPLNSVGLLSSLTSTVYR